MMKKPRMLFGLIFAMLGSIWTLQGVGIVDGSIFNARIVAIAAGVVTALAGLVIMAWAQLGRPKAGS